MLETTCKQNSFYSELYHIIPENHILKQINSAISLGFVNELLADRYCRDFGRPAKEPEMMVRIQILKYLYNVSDEQLIQDLQVNLAYKWFIGLNPEDPLPETSLLTKFRTQRLQDTSMDTIILEIVRQCVEKGIIKSSNGIAIDTTHIEANTKRKVPERIMKHLARKIFKAKGQEDYEIPDYTKTEDPAQAKQVMEGFTRDLIEQEKDTESEEVAAAVQEAKDVLESDLFIEQKGIRSLVDKDARVGHKSKTDTFFGYKAEFCQTTDGGLITGVEVESGAYVDGSKFQRHLENALACWLSLTGVYGDKAYFRPDILGQITGAGAVPYIPVSASAYRINEELYYYNKDSDQWFCVMGNATGEGKLKTSEKRGKKTKTLHYSFERGQCRNCPKREECLGKSKRVGKQLHIGVNTPELYEYSQRAKTPEFQEEYKKRAKIEPKNAELKRFHGLDRAQGYGLKSVRTQAKLTVLAVNLKRIAKLVSASGGQLAPVFKLFYHFFPNFCRNRFAVTVLAA